MLIKRNGGYFHEVPQLICFDLHGIVMAYWREAWLDYLNTDLEALAAGKLDHVFESFVRYYRWYCGENRIVHDTTSGVCPECGGVDGRVFYQHRMEICCHLHRLRWDSHGYIGPYPVPDNMDAYGTFGLEVVSVYKLVNAKRAA